MSVNCFCFTGNVGQEPEIRTLPTGTPVMTFSVAATSGFGNRKNTFWVRCSLFGNRATAMDKFISKGIMVAVAGELNVRSFDKKDGSKGYSVELNVSDLQIMSTRGGAGATSNDPKPEPERAHMAPDTNDVGSDDELPF